MTDIHGEHALWTGPQSRTQLGTLSIQDIEPSHALLSGLLLLVGTYIILQRLDYFPLLPLTDVLFNALVYATPSSLIMALDSRAATSMGKETENGGVYSESRTFAAKSEAFRRLIGWDGAGIVQRARALSGVGSLLKGRPPHALPGLGNLDNSCYQNSIIQGLAALPSLPDFLRRIGSNQHEDRDESMTVALEEIISELNDPENVGEKLWTPAVLKSMSSWQQQDAQEYLSKIMDDLEKEYKKRKQPHEGLREVKSIQAVLRGKSGAADDEERPGTPQKTFSPASVANSIPNNPLEGLMAQRVGCLQCGYVEGLSLIPFNCITLPLEHGFRLSYPLEDCLDKYTDLENIEGVDCGRCTLLQQKEQLGRLLSNKQTASAESFFVSVKARLHAVEDALQRHDYSEGTITKKCAVPKSQRVSSTKTRQAVVARCPDSLVLHVNRSVFNETNFSMMKNNARVTFPINLDLSAWALGREQEEGAQAWSTDPRVSLLAGSTQETDAYASSHPRAKGSEYSLRAIIIHQGRHENGHYVCYRQDPLDLDQWWRLSDETVYQVSQHDVLGADGVYMLFYDRTQVQEESFSNAAEAAPSQVGSTAKQVGSTIAHPAEEVLMIGEGAVLENTAEVAEASLPLEALAHDPTRSATSTAHLVDHESRIHDEGAGDLTKHVSKAGTAKSGAVSDGDLLEDMGSQPVAPPMRTAGAREKRGRKGKSRVMPEMSNMVVAN